MKYLFVSDVSINDDLSGAERVLFEQTTRLASRGHDVDILTRRLATHESDNALIQNVREYRYRVYQDRAIFFLASTIRNGKILFEILNLHRHYDCINFHQPFSAYAVSRSQAAKRIRKVYTCHSLSFEEYVSRNSAPQSIYGRMMHILNRESRKWIERRTLNIADHIIVLSQYTQEKLINTYRIAPDKITIVPGGIDLTRFHPSADKLKARQAINLPRDKMILLTIRGLEPRMGLENLIRAMQNIVKSIPDTHLIIGGSGPLMSNLIAMSRSLNLDRHIEFTGFIPEVDLPKYYQAADIFVLPTAELEGFGLVTLEALASGTPVLGTPVGGTKEILSALDDRFLFRDTSHTAISRSVVEFCDVYRRDPIKWQSDSIRCRNFVEKHYSWETNIDATERVLLEVSADNGSHWQ